jgi:hypothetical protein
MQSLIKNESSLKKEVKMTNRTENEAIASNILDIIKLQQEALPFVLENSEKYIKAKEKVIKQLVNMYKNTRLSKYLIQNNPIATKIEYKKIKGLMLNIEKRMCWYLNIKGGFGAR